MEMQAPAMKLTMAIEAVQDPDFVKKLIPLLATQPLASILEQPFVAAILPRYLRWMMIVTGFAVSLCGVLMLYILSRPPLGFGIFTAWQWDVFAEPFMIIRGAGFGAIILGLVVATGGWLWRRR